MDTNIERNPNAENKPDRDIDLAIKNLEDIFDKLKILRDVEKIGPKEDTKKERINQKLLEFEAKYEKFLPFLLKKYDVAVEPEKIADGIYKIQADDEYLSSISELPEGYAYMGGAARSGLERKLGIDSASEPRDLDVVRLTKTENIEIEKMLSRTLMDEDYSNGYGVKQIEDDYFSSRDFTVNEVLLYKDNLYMTTQCLLDTVRGIIRFSKNEIKEQNSERVFADDKLKMKAIRLSAKLTERGPRKLVDYGVYESRGAKDFQIALQLDRAMETSYDVAEAYVNELVKRGIVDESLDTPNKLTENIRNDFYINFVFRYALSIYIKNEDIYLSEIEIDMEENPDKYKNVANQIGKFDN